MRIARVYLYFIAAVSILFVEGCRKERFFESVEANPVSVFEEAWTVINERYALFPEKGLNWDSVRLAYQGKFDPGMSNQALFAELSRMLETLKDGHISLISPFDSATYSGFYTGYPRNFNYDILVSNYLSPGYGRQGPFIYDIREQVGYIYYGQFSSQLKVEDLRMVIGSMKGTRGLILDVRDNIGGYLQAAELLASAFIRDPLIVKYEQYKSGKGRNEYTEPEPRRIVPGDVQYSGRVIVLTNRSCFSACNDLVLYTTSMPQVKRYGDQTGGGGSIPSGYKLANGWILQFSATRTLSPKRLSVEAGILPDRKVEIGPLDDFAGRDPILEAAYLDLK